MGTMVRRMLKKGTNLFLINQYHGQMRTYGREFRVPVVLISTACRAVVVQLTVNVKMDTFELQLYKRDKWEFDSYYTD
jgi:hypothetical protein